MTIEKFPTEDVRKKAYRERGAHDARYLERVEAALRDAVAADVQPDRLQHLLVYWATSAPLMPANPLRDGQDIRQLDNDLYFLEQLEQRASSMARMYRNGRRRMTGSPFLDYDHLDQRRFGDFTRF